jgi:hypothetical protein
VLDLAANYDDLSTFIGTKITPEFLEYGLELSNLLVENISLPEEVEQALDKRTSMGIVGNLNDYLRFQMAGAVQASASNPSGASAGLEMGVGLAMANELNRNLAAAPTAAAAAQPPPIPGQEAFYVVVNGAKAGPFDLATLQQKIQQAEVNRATLVWHHPLSDWLPAEQITALASIFPRVPPSVPGA